MTNRGTCQRCGTENALNVLPADVVMNDERVTLHMCEFCTQIPQGIMRHGDGVAYAVVGNILARLIRDAMGREERARLMGNQPGR